MVRNFFGSDIRSSISKYQLVWFSRCLMLMRCQWFSAKVFFWAFWKEEGSFRFDPLPPRVRSATIPRNHKQFLKPLSSNHLWRSTLSNLNNHAQIVSTSLFPYISGYFGLLRKPSTSSQSSCLTLDGFSRKERDSGAFLIANESQ